MTGAVWPDLLSSAERAALDPGVPTPWPATPDVLVVGGGVVGLAVAAACQRAGVGSVLVVERDRLGAGASGGAAGLLTPEPHVWTDPPALVDLGRASLARYRRLDAECNGALGVRNLDALIVLPVMPPPSLVVSAGVELLTADAAVAVEPALGDPVAFEYGHQVTFSIHDGIVTLTGTMTFPHDIETLQWIVGGVPGVVEIYNQATADRPEPKSEPPAPFLGNYRGWP